MRRSMIAVMAVVVLAGSALARPAPFEVNVIDAGGLVGGTGPQSIGNPITWTGGPSYNPVIGSNLPPSAQQIAAFPQLQWDSYWTIDTIGPSTPASSTTASDGYTAQGPSLQQFPLSSPTTPFEVNSWSGVWAKLSPGGFGAPSGSDDRVFIGQVTLAPGSSLSTLGVWVNLRDFVAVNNNGVLGPVKFGAANASNNGGQWGFNYYLDVDVMPTNLGGQFAGWVTHAVYLKAIPAPGAAGLLAVAGVVAARRRRRALPRFG
ncbi:MAG: hypothetical protein ACKVZJ_10530 [Phycisphaerales bacterium]